MTACAVKGHGATLGLGSGSGATSIGKVVSIDGPSMTVGTVECTNLSSTFKGYLSTLPDGGEIGFTLNWDAEDSGQSAVLALISAPSDDQAWTLTLSDDTAITFEGVLTQFAFKGIEPEGIVQCECSIKVNGEVEVS